jgi:hypothetical protein
MLSSPLALTSCCILWAFDPALQPTFKIILQHKISANGDAKMANLDFIHRFQLCVHLLWDSGKNQGCEEIDAAGSASIEKQFVLRGLPRPGLLLDENQNFSAWVGDWYVMTATISEISGFTEIGPRLLAKADCRFRTKLITFGSKSSRLSVCCI